MAKQRYQVKRKASAVPKGIPTKKARTETGSAYTNPFENARASTAKSPKFLVHNRLSSTLSSSQKQDVHTKSALARAIESRQEGLKEALRQEKKAGVFIDRRIGEGPRPGISGMNAHSGIMTPEERMLARVVRERVSRSKRTSKYQLDDAGDEELLTHKGKTLLDTNNKGQLAKSAAEDVLLSSDDELDFHGQLDKVDTDMHFGGGAFDSKRRAQMNPYGPSNGMDTNLGEVYRSRKQDLDDLIAMKKREKLLKMQRKEQQVEKFEELDEHFDELAHLLQFRDKEADRRQKAEARKHGNLIHSEEDLEMDEWDKEMKEYLFERKVKATDRTKSPEEIAKEKADKLQKMESRRLARMNQEFENDNLSDISDQDQGSDDSGNGGSRLQKRSSKQKSVKRKNPVKTSMSNPEELDSDEDPSGHDSDVDVRFSGHDGLIYTDKRGNIVKKTADSVGSTSDEDHLEKDSESSEEEDELDESESTNEEDNVVSDDNADSENDDDEEEDGSGDDDIGSEDYLDMDSDQSSTAGKGKRKNENDLVVGTKVLANYRADEQFDNRATWYQGVIRKVYRDDSGKVLYDVDYDDGDFEEGVRRENIKTVVIQTDDEKVGDMKIMKNQEIVQTKRFKATERARQEMPFIFEIPTTLDALHEMIGKYAQSGRDASVIIQRIHECNSLHLNKANKDKIQNFYDVLIRRFIAVGDALYESGDGGPELERHSQLDILTKTLYALSQESPDIAGAMWSRRLGIMYSAMVKRLNDSEFLSSDDHEQSDTFWPSMGSLLLLRALPHIFPCTDLRHVVVTPALLFIGQCLTNTPIKSKEDLIRGLFLSCLMIEYTKDAKRVAPEAFAFIAGSLQLFSVNSNNNNKGQLPNLALASRFSSLSNLRQEAVNQCNGIQTMNELNSLQLPLEKTELDSDLTSLVILVTTLQLIGKTVTVFSGQMHDSARELFQRIAESLSCLQMKAFSDNVSEVVSSFINNVEARVRAIMSTSKNRSPLLRRTRAKASQLSIQTLAPRMENPSSFSVSRGHGKDRQQAEKDSIRREYKREHKAISRELRLDAAFIENERRKEKDAKDSKARDQRHKNFAWLVQEQATLNQQVAKGGGLLKGGGTGAARAKAASGKIGIKKGGKFRS